ATIVADTAGSSSIAGSDAAAVDFEVGEAEELKETLTERLATAVAERRSEGTDSFEWIDGDAEGDGSVGAAEGVEGDERTGAKGSVEGDERTGAKESVEGDERTGGDQTGSDGPVEDAVVDAEADGATTEEPPDEEPEIPDDGVVRPDFSPSDRDYSEPAERIDTGGYAVDQNPSDADVAHGPRADEAGDADETEDDGDGNGTNGDRNGDERADADDAGGGPENGDPSSRP
ncbi:hypothetical protein DJ71_22980, partial [Halorubrum sp. E3]